MNSHGDFTVEVVGNAVLTYVKGGFNEYGIKDYSESVLTITNNYNSWVLCENVDNSGGLTPEAVKELISCYQEFKLKGCVAIAVCVNKTYQEILERNVFMHVNLPTSASQKVEEIKPLLTKLKSDE